MWRTLSRNPVPKLRRLYDLQSELGGLLGHHFDLLFAIPLLVILGSFVHVLLTVLQHSVDDSGQLVRHGFDCLRGTQLGPESTVLRSQIGLASLQRGRRLT